MLALCWLIFRSWASFFHSGTPLARLLGVFLLTVDFFFAFWVAPGRMFGHPGTISRVRNYFFWCFVVRAGLQCEKIAHVQKPQFFLCFCMVFTYCELSLQATKQRKIIPGACSTELPAKIVLPFRLEMDSGRGLALSGASLDRLLFALGRLLASLGPFLGVSWALLGRSALDIPPLKRLK